MTKKTNSKVQRTKKFESSINAMIGQLANVEVFFAGVRRSSL
jgi:hypothetical protein